MNLNNNKERFGRKNYKLYYLYLIEKLFENGSRLTDKIIVVGKFLSDTFSDHDSLKIGDVINVNVRKYRVKVSVYLTSTTVSRYW